MSTLDKVKQLIPIQFKYKQDKEQLVREIGRAQDVAMTINAFTQLASAALGGWMACDMRIKHEVASLEYTEVDDTLSKLAFAVKALREHS